MNIVALTGNLTADPQIRVTNSGVTVATFAIAVNEGYGDKEKTSFPSIVAWGKSADFCGNYLHKGSKVNIKGRLQTRSYDNKDGQKVYVTEVVADMYGGVEALDKKSAAASQSNSIDDEEIPF